MTGTIWQGSREGMKADGRLPDSHILYSLSKGINNLIPQNALDIPVTQWEGLEEHGVQRRRTGEEAVKRACVSLMGLQQ